MTWHPEQMNVWCSQPRIRAVSSGITFVRINSALQAVQRNGRTLTSSPRSCAVCLLCLSKRRRRSLAGAGTPVASRRENEFAHAEKDMTTYDNRVGILTSSSNILLSVPFAQFSGAHDSGPNVPIRLRDCRGYPGVGSASARGLVVASVRRSQSKTLAQARKRGTQPCGQNERSISQGDDAFDREGL